MRSYLLLGVLPLMLITSCTQPLTTSGSIASASDVFAEGRGALAIKLSAIAELRYATDGLLSDIALSWRPEEPSSHLADDDGKFGPRALDCLAEAVYYEARSEPLAGQRAVAQVVLNRTGKRGFAKSVCGVVRQRSANGSLCQFSFNCDGSMAARREQSAWLLARRIAKQSLAGEVSTLAGAATYYHATTSAPDWASRFKRIGQIGSQIFYRS